MSEYDSILKEKKVKKVVVKEETKKFHSFSIGLVLTLIILVVSYIIYFNSVLSPQNIIIDDYRKILDKYKVIVKNMPLEEFNNGKNLVGMIEYNEDIFNFNFIKDERDFNLNISNNDKHINYFFVDNNSFVKVLGINEYVSVKPEFTIDDLILLKDNFSKIDDDKYIKSFYFFNDKPVVEINLALNTDDLNEIFGFDLSDDYEVIASFKNGAIMNNIEEIKIIINNKSTENREVVTMDEDKILYTVNNDTYKIVLNTNEDNFMVKVSKGDVLYSVLNGEVVEDTFVYTYQIINTIYNISIVTSKVEDDYLYEIVKKKDDLVENIKISIKVEDGYVVDEGVTSFVDSSNGLISDTFTNEINYFKDKFLKFIN